jgi:enoyl-CoA hydratase
MLDEPEEGYAASRAFIERGQGVNLKIEKATKPVIAAINGFCLGGGLELAMACHMRICSDRARLGQPEINLGIIPGWGGTQRLARIIGKGKAIELILTGDMTTAQEAYRLGLVNKVVPAGAVLKEAQGLARKIVSKSKVPVAAALRAITEGLAVPIEEGLRIEADQFVGLADTDDIREGVNAFLEKRQPDFKDK